MSFILLRPPSSSILLLPRSALRSATSPVHARLTSSILRALRPQQLQQQPASRYAFSTWRGNNISQTTIALIRGKTQQLSFLKRQYAWGKKSDPLVPARQAGQTQVANPEEGMRLLDRLKHRGQISDLGAPPPMTNVQPSPSPPPFQLRPRLTAPSSNASSAHSSSPSQYAWPHTPTPSTGNPPPSPSASSPKFPNQQSPSGP